MTSIFLERSFLASTWTFFSQRVSNFRLSILFRKYDIEFYIAPHHFFLFLLPLLRRSSREQTTASCSFSPASWPVCFTCFDFVSFVFSRNISTFQITSFVVRLELVSKELNHFGVIADLFRQIGGHSSRFVLFCSFWRLFTIKMIKSVKVFPFSFWKIITIFFLLHKIQMPGINMQNGRQVI